MSSSAQSRRDVTYFYEKWRAVGSGVLETASGTFLLLIAVKYFSAGSTAKAWIATGGSAGLLISPLVVSWVTSWGWRASTASAILAAAGGVAMLAAALFPILPVFVVGSVLGMILVTSIIPFLTQMYQDNYPEKERGRLFSKANMIRIGIAAAFSEAAGRTLTGHLERFQLLLLLFAGALFFLHFVWLDVHRDLSFAMGAHTGCARCASCGTIGCFA